MGEEFVWMGEEFVWIKDLRNTGSCNTLEICSSRNPCEGQMLWCHCPSVC